MGGTLFLCNNTCSAIQSELATPDIEGIYETQVPLMLRALAQIGCVCRMQPQAGRRFDPNDVDVGELALLTPADGYSYMKSTGGATSIRHLYLYAYAQDTRATVVLAVPATSTVTVWLLDQVRVEQVPNVQRLFNDARQRKAERQADTEAALPKASTVFDVRTATGWRELCQGVQRLLKAYEEAKCGATMLCVHASSGQNVLDRLVAGVPVMKHMPVVTMPLAIEAHLYSTTLDWPRAAAQRMIFHYLNSILYIDVSRVRIVVDN